MILVILVSFCQPRTIEIEETLFEAATKGLHDQLPSRLQRIIARRSSTHKTILKISKSTLRDDQIKRQLDHNKSCYACMEACVTRRIRGLQANVHNIKVDSYLARTLTIVNKMKANGDSLTSEESINLDTMTIDELHGSLLVHEQRMIGQQDDVQALKITGGSPSRGRGRGRGGMRERGRGRSSFDKSTIECYKCHKLGHFQYECPD
ncbi:retrovirus-related pol polyprotein from transposon TNT 1-94 [Tanacetum coccineum]